MESKSRKKSADPGLRQGRGGAWDRRRCGTCFVTMALTLSRVLPCTPLRSLSFRKPSQGKLNTAFGRPFAGLSKATLLAPLATFQGNTTLRKPFQAKNTLPRQPSKHAPCTSWQPATTAICSSASLSPSHHGHLFFRKGVQGCRLPALKPLKPSKPSKPSASLSPQPPRPSVFKGVQGCRLPALKPSKPSASLFPPDTTAICF